MHNFDFLIPIAIFGSIAFVLFKFFDDRHRERMAIIEKGLVKEDVKFLYSSSHTWRMNPLSSLKWGMLAAFIGLGILMGAVVSAQFAWMENRIMPGFIFFFGGIGLILFYAMVAKKMPDSAN